MWDRLKPESLDSSLRTKINGLLLDNRGRQSEKQKALRRICGSSWGLFRLCLLQTPILGVETPERGGHIPALKNALNYLDDIIKVDTGEELTAQIFDPMLPDLPVNNFFNGNEVLHGLRRKR